MESVDMSPIDEDDAVRGGSGAAEIGALVRPYLSAVIQKLVDFATGVEKDVSHAVRLAAIREFLNRVVAVPETADEKQVMHLYQWVTKEQEAIPDPSRQRT
jgi:hypothetical protein